MSTRPTRFFAVIGHPIGHSLSPLMHQTAMDALGLPSSFVAREVRPELLSDDVHTMIEEGCDGFNVTIPHKERIIELLDEIDDEAKRIGAVNTVVARDGQLRGYNTDVYGIARTLTPYEQDVRGGKAVLLGAGGAARAAADVLIHKFGVERLTIATRTVERGEMLAKSLRSDSIVHVMSITDREVNEFVRDAALIVNATPVGMSPHVDASPLPPDAAFHEGQIVFDLIYRPLQTTLLRHAVASGATTVAGLDMFLHQGAKAFELWTGKQMPMEVVRKALEERLRV